MRLKRVISGAVSLLFEKLLAAQIIAQSLLIDAVVKLPRWELGQCVFTSVNGFLASFLVKILDSVSHCLRKRCISYKL